jgi:hypothetical protein
MEDKMASIISRKAADAVPKEKKFKKFKITLEFNDRDDALGFAAAIEDHDIGVAKELVSRATK